MRLRAFLLALVMAPLCAALHAKPYVPADDAQVLERLPARPLAQARELDRLRAAVRAAPEDPVRAAALADAWYALSRAEGDPRYLGYAQAALAPWWQREDAPTPVLLARATIRQSTHDFKDALADLDRVLAREPRQARALLVRATLGTVQGRYADARRDCARLLGVAPELYVFGCMATVDALTGRSASASALLQRALAASGADDAQGRGYAESLQGELAHRVGGVDAERHFRAALAAELASAHAERRPGGRRGGGDAARTAELRPPRRARARRRPGSSPAGPGRRARSPPRSASRPPPSCACSPALHIGSTIPKTTGDEAGVLALSGKLRLEALEALFADLPGDQRDKLQSAIAKNPTLLTLAEVKPPELLQNFVGSRADQIISALLTEPLRQHRLGLIVTSLRAYLSDPGRLPELRKSTPARFALGHLLARLASVADSPWAMALVETLQRVGITPVRPA